jgi:hypothetical protein
MIGRVNSIDHEPEWSDTRKRAIAIVGRVPETGFPTVSPDGDGDWCIANDNPWRWAPGEAVLIRFNPYDQFATILDPETLEPM